MLSAQDDHIRLVHLEAAIKVYTVNSNGGAVRKQSMKINARIDAAGERCMYKRTVTRRGGAESCADEDHAEPDGLQRVQDGKFTADSNGALVVSESHMGLV